MTALLIFTKFGPEFDEVDYSLVLESTYGLTTPIDAMLLEAGQKGMVVAVQASLVDASPFLDDPEGGEATETPQGDEG